MKIGITYCEKCDWIKFEGGIVINEPCLKRLAPLNRNGNAKGLFCDASTKKRVEFKY